MRIMVMVMVCAFFTVICGSEENNTIWGLNTQDFIYQLDQDNSFLKNFDYSNLNLQDLIRLHPGSYYYMYLHYQELGLTSLQQEMLTLAWDRLEDPWRYEAGVAILTDLVSKKHYKTAERVSSEGLLYYKNDPTYLGFYLEALYWLKKDRVFTKYITEYTPQLEYENTYPFWVDRPRTSETQLWNAVIAYRNNKDYLHEFEKLFYAYNAQSFHSRAYLYIIDEKRIMNSLDEWHLALFRSKYYGVTSNYSKAATQYQTLLETLPPTKMQQVWTARTIRDAGQAFYYANKTSAGIKLMNAVGAGVVPASQSYVAAQEWIARMHQKRQELRKSYQAFERGFNAVPSDRMLWLMFDVAFNRSASQGIASMRTYGNRMVNKRYFSDLFERNSSLAIRNRNWKLLWDLRTIANMYGAPYDKARLAVLTAEAVRSGATSLPRGVTRTHLRRDLEYARSQVDSSFYAHLAGHLIGKNANQNWRLPTRPARARIETPHNTHHCRTMIEGANYFGLYAYGYTWVVQCAPLFETTQLIELARTFNVLQKYHFSIRTMDIARRRNDFIIGEKDSRLLYPQGYREYIEPIARKHSFSPLLFYSTVREESYFNPGVSSHAGAVGLAQIIPRTARVVAQRMQIPTPDLTIPSHNLALGGFHIRELLDAYSQRTVPALAAYNAGPRRVAQWESKGRGLSSLLVHESFHIFETRHYIRKILTSHLKYNRIYGNNPDYAIVKTYYPDLVLF